MPSNIQVCGTWHNDGGLFGDAGEAVAACIFTIPPTRWSEDVFELARLVRREDAKVSLTGLISETCAFIRRKKMADLLVSFADWTHEHHGGVYQSASWQYDGRRDRTCDGLLIDGHFIGGRAANHKYGARSPSAVAERLGTDRVQPHYDEGKYLYWRPLSGSGKKKAIRLGLQSKIYPKPKPSTVENQI